MGFIHEDIWGVDDPLAATPVFHNADQVDWQTAAPTGINGLDQRIAYATGVIWRPALSPANNFRMTFDYVEQGDGQGYTILFAENVDAGNWDSIDADEIGFGVSLGHFNDGSTAVTVDGDGDLSEIGDGTVARIGSSRINSKFTGAGIGTAPRPSSNHGDIVHVGMCDGTARSINANIDTGVYLRLITPNGQRLGEGLLDPGSF
jgi:hypothetical protein